MIEVFKTNVNEESNASLIVLAIKQHFDTYLVNFDLEDCDRILRVENPNGLVCANDIISIVVEKGFAVQVLEDTLEPIVT